MNSNLQSIRLFFLRVNISHRPAFSWQVKSAKITDNQSSNMYLIINYFKNFRFSFLGGFFYQSAFSLDLFDRNTSFCKTLETVCRVSPVRSAMSWRVTIFRRLKVLPFASII